jgi:hypothetical protein
MTEDERTELDRILARLSIEGREVLIALKHL